MAVGAVTKPSGSKARMSGRQAASDLDRPASATLPSRSSYPTLPPICTASSTHRALLLRSEAAVCSRASLPGSPTAPAQLPPAHPAPPRAPPTERHSASPPAVRHISADTPAVRRHHARPIAMPVVGSLQLQRRALQRMEAIPLQSRPRSRGAGRK